jgi:hypothetical protein
VVGADDDADGGHDEAFLLTVAGECDDETKTTTATDGGVVAVGPSQAGNPEKWKVPQWGVLAANRVGRVGSRSD